MHSAHIYTPAVTVFDKNGELDRAGNRALWEHLIAGGVDGIVLMGSTGEFFAMTGEQKRALIDEAASFCKGRTELLVGASCMRPEETIELANYALSRGAAAAMVIGPYYFSLSDAYVTSWFDAIAEGVAGPLYLYNFPARTGYDLKPEVVAALIARHDNIAGYKDTVTEMGHTRQILAATRAVREDFVVLSGYDEFLAHNVLSGGDGLIGGLSNVFPELFASWVRAINAGDAAGMACGQRLVDELMGLYDIGTPFIPILKRAVALRGVPIGDACTAPLLSPDEEQAERIQRILNSTQQKL